MQKTALILTSVLALTACAGKKTEVAASDDVAPEVVVNFDADSAYSYVERQVAFGPRVPNTEAHRRCGEWLASELRRRGADVTEQRSDLTAFDGTVLKAVNILGRFNTESPDRLLLLAHWDCRPWADQDPNPDNRKKPVDGANDGASGVGVLLEIARQLSEKAPGKGVDILFVDAEDWGTEGSEDSWALGARYFMEHPPVEGYLPDEAILLDMVGGKGAVFCREYFSEQAAPRLAQSLWGIAASRGYGDLFLNKLGGAVTDDHVQLIEKGVPAVDIIEYHPEQESGFNPHWHTVSDNMENIDRATLKAVGETVMQYLITNY
ncbi:M28 family peptidase [Lepagella muris]|jgi:acetylornithine deacetylase/succinyl-diaminopimelate desuccinylase-like protein|uniref:M28 family peptidase n=1 Tax=Lepagella muris TaxID=3032870 RepID=A0AC61RIR0_9BACT|nr:M28 family peptidase [Lepagella muris]ROT04426.1 M28 family peptidase [Muribaculaceae bacterium Isolate-037 (Harlan)]TGY79540.1 M28 family peptidase [Lepagella muris]THG53010.1 M28 family peptidase [Bacteroidales bacterium]TKC61930.1 M28 family peptidase [Bacteroidales bacterium]